MVEGEKFYELQLFVLATFCVGALLIERYASAKRQRSSLKEPILPNGNGAAHGIKGGGYHSLTRRYLLVYAIVMGADWLQGPYVYSLYHEQYAFPERIVAILFVTGFTSAGVFSPIVGTWADQNGRKRMCLVFCMTYALSCILMLFPFLPVLLVGRVLGGFSTSILFSCFESWLISASNSYSVTQTELSSIMGRATTMNGFVAAAAGVASNALVKRSGSYLSPFLASAVLLSIGWLVIGSVWDENYGGESATPASEKYGGISRLQHAWSIVRQDSSLLTLLLTQTLFEGSMYLFVFLWVPSLQEVSSRGIESLPFGYIFSSFMISMMLGSLVYTCVITYSPKPTQTKEGDESLALHTKLASLLCAMAAFTFAVASSSRETSVRFWAFCLFEACVGMYYPVMGVLRGKLVPDEVRATLYSLFRLPLNTFVTISLLTGTGQSSSRHAVWTGCAGALIVASLCLARMLVVAPERVVVGRIA